jgi:putative transcriptional regulator
MDSEMKKVQGDLLASVRQMQRGEVARVTEAKLPPVAEVRASVSMSQQEFAKLLES